MMYSGMGLDLSVLRANAAWPGDREGGAAPGANGDASFGLGCDRELPGPEFEGPGKGRGAAGRGQVGNTCRGKAARRAVGTFWPYCLLSVPLFASPHFASLIAARARW